jgi:riboflavin synthase
MFTGLVDDVGVIEATQGTPAGLELVVASAYVGLTDGESVAINGACLTVRSSEQGRFRVAAAWPTLERTTIGTWGPGRRVNLERAMQATDRFGGHIVQGHVDGVARVLAASQEGDARLIDLALPPGLAELMVLHGSVALDGVSLTVNNLREPNTLQVMLIDYTLRHTTLGVLAVGDQVHVEADVVAKHIKRLMGR